MTSIELQLLILDRLVRAHGGSRQSWRRALGSIVLYSPATHPHCNWEVRASGAGKQIDAIERMVDTLRHVHPIVTRD